MEQLKASMEELKKNVTRQAYQLTNEINSVTNSGCSEYFVMNNGVRQDVIAFPKTTTAQCALTRAPSEVDPQQLKDLSFKTH
ncbi:hypothetical protein FEM48_Zijuj09G0142600 [Ziziphus jujuba var. spinosa]|uniref:Uncharacterized protein n=1 Tax=Ziziphus jujuba var. spinosa TaxID=714518 RepID=A0A978UTG3_ZIZJJ|nr:hypothetical protein FEM48_Zijuj09G0142600 [Ziziphus jujuba var. spinosa]